MDKPTERKSFPTFVKSIEGRVVEQIYSVFGVIDSYRDRIKKGAFKKTLSERVEKIRILWQHDFWLPPVGVLVEAREIPRRDLPDVVKERFPEATGGLLGVTEYLETDRGEEILVGIRKEAIRENSIGFDTIKSKVVEHVVSDDIKIRVRELLELRLWDLSPVNWGANPATANVKSAIPFKGTGTIEGEWLGLKQVYFTGREWGTLSDSELVRIANHFAWSTKMPPNNFDELKLPHHAPRESGIGPAHKGGVVAAMNQLLQAKANVTDKEAVYDHLAQHYKEFEMEPPSFSLIPLAYSVRAAMEMDEADLLACYEELEALSRALKEAEPQSGDELRLARTHFGHLQLQVQTLQHYINSDGG
jgi:HK97 family phage prohead protease